MSRLVQILAIALGVHAIAHCAPIATNTYVGSRVCSSCHQSIYKSFIKTDMGQSMRRASDSSLVNLPGEATIQTGVERRSDRVYRDGEGWHQSQTEPNVFSEDYQLDYAIGSGRNGLTFLIQRGRFLFQAPLSYYSGAGNWGLSPGYENVDLGFTRVVPQGCTNCHSGRAQGVATHSGEYRDPPFLELAIGCENCHGPGSAHVNSSGRTPGSIVNPAKLPARRAEEICMNCHQRGDTRVLQPGKTFSDFQPGHPLLETLAIFKVPNAPSTGDLLEHHEAMKASRCFRASQGRLSCLTCHDPHTQPHGEEAVAYFRSKCLTCHTDASCRLSLPTRLAQHPANNCIGCHMPKRDIRMISHSALTNHTIPAVPSRAPVPEDAADPSTGLILTNKPGGGTPIPLSDVTLLRAYAELVPQYPEYRARYLDLLARLGPSEKQERFVQAALGDKALSEGKNEDALTHLNAAMSLDEAAIYRDIAQALNNLGRKDEAIACLQKATTIYPYDPELNKTLILNFIEAKRYAEARQGMENYVKVFPGDKFMRGLLARVSR